SCGKEIILRILLGYSVVQEHNFHCPECNAELGIKLNLDQENGTWEFTNYKMCEETDQHSGIFYNLNPNFVVPKDQLHSSNSAYWMQQHMELMSTITRNVDLEEYLS